jgi:hypothetical protein
MDLYFRARYRLTYRASLCINIRALTQRVNNNNNDNNNKLVL